ncbi:V-type ATP synthase subunit I [Entomospira culicis]|uniref:V-type ATP synthase subunit I n=1 Tax=Entomospira culicis TaxID=2719989 RepID=A0A968KTZ4_9SPIO|nr:V-type ATPase 116kDa subunit family protein [Entomospira culicis]NIZ18429.1 hypothetical protein [Entomospira culicis]NIZ68645.1 hypothetical protein [Entomospira culicis]WDI37245.1 V-type ATPase 116kDa subunit family protein [Entomospira culicis]WDI38873.1 V-type ATPase 116kDa subunit family protein [Entomospira culicis]
MLLTEKMEYLSAIVLSQDVDSVTKRLLAVGAVEFAIDAHYRDQEGVRQYSKSTTQNKIADLRRRCGTLLELGKIAYPDTRDLEVSRELPALDLSRVENLVGELNTKIASIREEQRRVQQRLHEMRILQKRLLSYTDNQVEHALLSYRGLIPLVYAPNLQKKLKSFSLVSLETNHVNELALELLFNKSDAPEIMKILERYRLSELAPSNLDEVSLRERFRTQLEASLQGLVQEQEQRSSLVENLLQSEQASLQSAWLALRAKELYEQIQGQFNSTNTTVIFSGWVPASEKMVVIEALKEATQGRAIIQLEAVPVDASKSEVQAEPPTKLKNNVVSRPYELLVNTYGVVKYGQVDPTFMVSIFFTLMFGLMFADAGQGLVIFFLGIYLWRRAYKAKSAGASLMNAGKIVTYCGLSAIFFGVMFGSYFGFQWLAPVWFDLHGIVMTGEPHHTTASSIQSIYGIFALSFKIGFVVIGTGFLFNAINQVRKKNYFALVFGANGLLGALFYASAMHMIWDALTQGLESYPYRDLVPLLLVGIAVSFILIPVKHTLEENKKEKRSLAFKQIVVWPLQWLFELYEMMIGYFSSTVSFIRIGAMGMVHVVLMSVFYSMAQQSPYLWLSIVIIVFANVLVIALEGLLAAVNSMRLQFYEFFSRYFESGGRIYQPISLHEETGKQS